ncbi:MAG TPA: type IV toxin-antitoxin system AbiEi family antitoxin domain-containing protein [Spirochaetia bacterium]|nr:type IV toxin-antitoxin system AbiEi family antitoxin domain-containing protein [Spirochaetia bacterium]
MKPETRERILDIVSSHGGYASSSILFSAGFHPAQLADLVNSGSLTRIKRGLYALAGGVIRSELADVQRAMPGCVFCLGTALSIHGIGTWEPIDVQLAVRRDRRIALPDFPPIRLYSFSGVRFELGVEEHETEAGTILVYDREKTICDILRFRKAIGLDIAMEALREYLKSTPRNVQKLFEYAKRLRMEGTIRGYAEALL